MYPQQLLLFILLPISILATYLLIRLAVKHGTRAALREWTQWKESKVDETPDEFPEKPTLRWP